jgi:hypothetical protein
MDPCRLLVAGLAAVAQRRSYCSQPLRSSACVQLGLKRIRAEKGARFI